MADNAPRKSAARRIATALAIVVGLVVVVIVALVLLVDSSAVTTRVVNLVLPRASQALGREVTVKGTHLSIFPEARVRLSGLTVAGRPGEPALVSADGIDVGVALWPLLVSRGKDLRVTGVALDRPAVNLVRARDGSWNYEGLGGEKGAPPGGAKPPPEPKQGGAMSVLVQRFSVRGGSIHMIDRSGGREESTVAVDQLDLDASGIGPGSPADVHLGAAVASEKKNLDLKVSVASLPGAVPARPEDWPAVQGSLAFGPIGLDRVAPLLPAGTSTVVRGGTATLDAQVATDAGSYRVSGAADVRDLLLRGQPAAAKLRMLATWSPAHPSAGRVEVRDLAVKGPGVDLGGNAAVELAPVRARFALSGPLLDLDALMGALPPSQQKAPEPAGPKGPLLPTPMRRQVEAASATGTLDLGTLRSGKLVATQVHAAVTLRDGVLEIQDLAAGLYGGNLSAAGTEVNLAAPEPAWKLKAKLDAVDLGQAMKAVAGQAPLAGKTSAALALDGNGIDWARLRDRLTGSGDLALRDGELTTADLGGQVLGAVSSGLSALGKGAAAKKVAGAGGKTSIKDLAAAFTVKNGWMELAKPLSFDTPAGPVKVGGRIGLDERLDLTGTVAVPRSALAGVAPAAVKLPESLAVPIGIGGSLTAPAIQVHAEQAVASLAKGQAQQALKGLQQEAQKRGGKAVGDVLKQMGIGK